MLFIEDLKANTGSEKILKGINLTVNKGEIHVIMGPNGSGKSTLSKVVAGHPEYSAEGKITLESNFKKKDILSMEPHERANEGIFLAFQYPLEFSGLSNFTFLKAIFNSACKKKGIPEMDAIEFKDFLQDKLELLKIDEEFLNRSVNEGFSGGEKKKNEILQLMLLNPKVAFLDETDSGLDVDSLKIVSNGINTLANENNAFVIVTHYNMILEHIKPDYVHILIDGKIVKSGDISLAKEIEERGYDWLTK